MAVLDRVSASESERLNRQLQPYERAARYVAEHFAKLVEEYPEQWVAVQDDRVLAHSRTHVGLKRLVSKAQPKVPAFVVFLTKKEQTLIL